MKKFTHLCFSIIAMISLMTSAVIAQDTEIPVTNPNGPKLTILSGVKGGSYYTMGKDMQKMTKAVYGEPVITTTTDANGVVTKTPTGDTINFLDNKESDGSYYNFIKINKLDVDLTFLQYDVLLYEDLQDLNRKFKKTANIRILLPMGVEQVHLITLKDSKIKEFGDLKGMRVAIGSPLQGTYITAKFIKEKVGGRWEEVELGYDKAFRALFQGDIDAFFFVGAAPVTNLGDLPISMKNKIKLISLPDNPGLVEAYGPQTSLTKAEYKWLEQDIKTYGVKSVLVTSVITEDAKKEAEKEAYLVKLLTEIKKNKDLPGYHPNWKKVQFKKDETIEWEYLPAILPLLN